MFAIRAHFSVCQAVNEFTGMATDDYFITVETCLLSLTVHFL